MHKVYLGLGTNLGHREQNLNAALDLIAIEIGEIIRKSSVHETKAWGKAGLPDFLNIVVFLETTLWPLALMAKILEIEKRMGRVRQEKWGSRLIDIDILYLNDWHFHTPGLIIPHPFIQVREFVMKPLSEVWQ